MIRREIIELFYLYLKILFIYSFMNKSRIKDCPDSMNIKFNCDSMIGRDIVELCNLYLKNFSKIMEDHFV